MPKPLKKWYIIKSPRNQYLDEFFHWSTRLFSEYQIFCKPNIPKCYEPHKLIMVGSGSKPSVEQVNYKLTRRARKVKSYDV